MLIVDPAQDIRLHERVEQLLQELAQRPHELKYAALATVATLVGIARAMRVEIRDLFDE